MSIELNTEASQRATELQARLRELTDRKEEYELLALEGHLSPEAVTQLEGERRFAEMRAEAAARAAEQEREALASNERLTKAFNDFLSDDTISVAAMRDALTAISDAVAAFKEQARTRDEAVKAWSRKLRALGVPTEGLTVDNLEATITSNGQITIDGRTVSPVSGVNAYILGALPPAIGTNRANADSLNLHDRRQRVDHLEVRVIKEVGGKRIGDVLSTRKGMSTRQLARMVHSGLAEVTAGDVPEPDLTERHFIASRNAEHERRAAVAATRMP
ncbi:hypothetical protein [Curtobacterium sp. NPDC086286]|uniref:hypothetical protein n=1 Tax=Curtobacterium sp. NPDC086286 TaxID=3363964 RepID=UPI0038045931